MFKQVIQAGLVACMSSSLLAGSPVGPPMYEADEFGFQFDADTLLSSVIALNEDGDGVGVASITDPNLSSEGFVHTDEFGPVLLPQIGALENARATAVSDRDASGEIVIAGVAGFNPFLPTQPDGIGVYWRYSTVSGLVTETGLVGPLAGHTISRALGINNAGQIVGFSQTANQIGATRENIVFDVNTGQLQTFEFPATPVDINNAGQVAGGRYVGDLNGNVTDLGHPEQTNVVDIAAINDHGEVAARIVRSFSDGNGFLVNGAAKYSGGWEILWSISRFDNAKGINNRGDVVGTFITSAAVYFDDLGQSFDVEALVSARGGGPFVEVSDINDDRRIGGGLPAVVYTPLGTETCPGDCDSSGVVDFNDLVSILGEFGGNMGGACDTDKSGIVDFNDLVATLSVFGACD